MATQKSRQFSVGIDFGTNSVRALIVDVATGEEIASAVWRYRRGKDGVLTDPKDPNLARQHPADYVEGLTKAVAAALRQAKSHRGFDPAAVVGIGVDTTGSTPLPVDEAGLPLALDGRWRDNLGAMAWLWKDHTAYAEAAEITERARSRGEPYLAKCGGTYSSEWFWSKILRCARKYPKVFEAAYAWVELSDFIPAYMTGNLNPATMPRNICAAGHKAMYNDTWGGLPSREFLESLDPRLATVRDRYAHPARTADQEAGKLRPDLARKMGLPPAIPVAVGLLDAHAGAVGSGIRPGRMVKIVGTSTCDMMVVPMTEQLADIPGLCGIVPGSIIPGMYGLEAGQSAVGDIFNWFGNHLAPGRFTTKGDVLENLTREAEKLRPGESGLLALDWNNGNRTVLVDPLLTGLLVGQTLHTTAPEVYRALVEATGFGALVIIRRFEEFGLKVEEVVACGGIAEKNPFVMQVYADILNRPIRIARSSQTCALGAAIFGAVVGGVYRSTEAAQRKMCGTPTKIYRPNRRHAEVYRELFELYRLLHDAFGTPNFPGTLYPVMKRLIEIRDRVRRS
ncbi:MAG: ribulokinase [Thermoguttaceae bacterium]|nr:ribulokinase [Thermoguttaceae bacterium]MDW8078414.1 ribulokinase [Thermoguttaceae bacterium]